MWRGPASASPSGAWSSRRRRCSVAAPLLGTSGERPPELRGPAALSVSVGAFLCPLTRAMVPGVEAAVDEFAPHVLVVDQQALAGALVAERAGLPWVTSATTSAELIDPLAGMPKVAAWLHELMADLRRCFGDPDAAGDRRFSPFLTLAFTTEALVGPIHRRGEPIRFVGPSLGTLPDGRLPWNWLDARTRVLVTWAPGTRCRPRFLGRVRPSAAGAPNRQAVIVDPVGSRRRGGARGSGVRAAAAAAWHLDAVVCHAGHNTVCETLSFGLRWSWRQSETISHRGEQSSLPARDPAALWPRDGSTDRRAVEAVLTQPTTGRPRGAWESFGAAGGAVGGWTPEELASEPRAGGLERGTVSTIGRASADLAQVASPRGPGRPPDRSGSGHGPAAQAGGSSAGPRRRSGAASGRPSPAEGCRRAARSGHDRSRQRVRSSGRSRRA